MHNHTLHRKKKRFCRYGLQAFRTEEISKCHIKDCFEINGKQKIIMSKKDEYVKFKNYERKIIKSPFIIYAHFESILVPEDNGEQNSLIQKNIKNVSMISLVSLLKHN